MLTQDQIKSERESVVGAALGWEHTPYHHMGEVKGAGADCVSFLRCAIIDARLGIEVSKLEYYPMDWHMHNDAERYMEGLMKYCVEMPATEERVPLPADIILFRMGRVFNHGALVINYPNMIHAERTRGVARLNLIKDSLSQRPRKVFTLKRWVE